MTHLWFTGSDVLAYNGYVAISIPLKTDFTGAVPGSMLLAMLKALSAKEVEFEEDGPVLHVRGGSSRVRFTTLPPEEFATIFKMPRAPDTVLGCEALQFIKGLNLCMRSVTTDTSIPDQLGVTVIPDNKNLLLFSLNRQTFTHASLPLKGVHDQLPKRAIIPTLFCKQLISLADKGEKLKLQLDGKSAMYARGDGLRMMGNLVVSERPLDMIETFDKHHPEANEKRAYSIAEKFGKIMERACIVAASEAKSAWTRIVIEKGKATFVTRSSMHEVKDTMDFPASQPDVKLTIDPKFVLPAVADFERMFVTERAIIMENKVGYFLVSGQTGS